MPYSAGDVVKSEFAGEYQLGYVDVDTDGATGDVTLDDDFDEVFVLSANLIEDPVTGCSSVTAKEDSSTKNKINIKLWKDDYSTADANYKDVRLTILGLIKSNP